MLLMVGRADEYLMMKLLDSIPAKAVSFRQLSYNSDIDRKTVRKYVRLIMQVQDSSRVKLEKVGLRLLVRKEKPDSEKTGISGCPPNKANMR